MKYLDLNKTVYELCTAYPELIDIMAGLGFTEITKKAALSTAGRVMTIPNGAKIKGIDMNDIIQALHQAGFQIEGPEDRVDRLRNYIERLTQGEDLELVRRDFVEHFQSVDASEIMQAEQELMMSGVPYWEVQQLCDVHSALFHGSTAEEKSIEETLQAGQAASLATIPGHPLSTLALENERLAVLLDQAEDLMDQDEALMPVLDELRTFALHYAKKGDLIYPLLKVRYGISGPSDVMWSVDDEIRDTYRNLSKTTVHDADWKERFLHNIQRSREMIYKETNILFPLCAQHFSKDEWIQLYQDSLGYEPCLMDHIPVWEEGTSQPASSKADRQQVVLPTGEMSVDQLRALLNTIPMEITFVDENNINRYFNEGWKLFKRPNSALGREVFTCHPPKIEPMVRKIIDDFKNGRRDVVDVWMEKMNKTVLVRYMAIRDENGRYIGTGEFVQEMDFAKAHFQKRSA